MVWALQLAKVPDSRQQRVGRAYPNSTCLPLFVHSTVYPVWHEQLQAHCLSGSPSTSASKHSDYCACLSRHHVCFSFYPHDEEAYAPAASTRGRRSLYGE